MNNYFEGYNGIPAMYDYKNVYNSHIRPSNVHTKNTALELFFEKYLMQKVFSVYEFDIPETWNKPYFLYTLFCLGFIAVIDTDKYGVICQHCQPYGRGVFYQPTNVIISNPLLKGKDSILKPLIGKECAVIKLMPSWTGIYDMVSFYASMMALCAESAGVNLLNSKLAYVFIADNKAKAESFKKMYDELAINPAVFADQKLFNEDGTPRWQLFNNNVSGNYIAGEILADLHRWENLFNTEIGIPNANFEKSERLITDEVNANNIDTKAKALLWLESMNDGMEIANKLFNLKLNVKLRFEYEEGNDDAELIDNRAL